MVEDDATHIEIAKGHTVEVTDKVRKALSDLQKVVAKDSHLPLFSTREIHESHHYDPSESFEVIF